MLYRKRRLLNPPVDFTNGGASDSPFAEDLLGRPKEPDPRLLDRRISQTAFLWRVGFRNSKLACSTDSKDGVLTQRMQQGLLV